MRAALSATRAVVRPATHFELLAHALCDVVGCQVAVGVQLRDSLFAGDEPQLRAVRSSRPDAPARRPSRATTRAGDARPRARGAQPTACARGQTHCAKHKKARGAGRRAPHAHVVGRQRGRCFNAEHHVGTRGRADGQQHSVGLSGNGHAAFAPCAARFDYDNEAAGQARTEGPREAQSHAELGAALALLLHAGGEPHAARHGGHAHGAVVEAGDAADRGHGGGAPEKERQLCTHVSARRGVTPASNSAGAGRTPAGPTPR
jgi:hypothetical protein